MTLTKDNGHGDLGQFDVLVMEVATATSCHPMQLKETF